MQSIGSVFFFPFNNIKYQFHVCTLLSILAPLLSLSLFISLLATATPRECGNRGVGGHHHALSWKGTKKEEVYFFVFLFFAFRCGIRPIVFFHRADMPN